MQPEGTKEHPAPLDGFESLKEGEPHFTLQGGDPLGAPMVQLWADLARVRAGVISVQACEKVLADVVYQASRQEYAPESERECDLLLLRATKAEEQGWHMAQYFKHGSFAEDQTPEEYSDLDEAVRIDLHDYRVKAAQTINGAVYEIDQIRQQLPKLGFNDEAPLRVLDEAFNLLRSASADIEPRRLFRA
jgi:hypothetical protein